MKVRILRKKTWRQGGLVLLLGLAATGLLRFPEAAAAGVSRGLSMCGEVIIPTLFPFLVLVSVFIRSGAAARVGRHIEWFTRRLFGVSGFGGTVWLIGALGGYPAGAAAVRDLLDRGELDREEASRLLLFCVNGGPAFIIGTVGARLLGYPWKGVMLYIAHLLASLLIGVFSRKRSVTTVAKNTPTSKTSLTKSLNEAVERACSSVLIMSGFVLLFSAFLALSDASGLTGAVTSVLLFPFTKASVSSAVYAAFWEVSCGSVALVGSGISGVALAFLLGAALGWGGVSVSAQIGGILSECALSKRFYWLARGWHALLGGGLSALLFALLPSFGKAIPTAVAPLYQGYTIEPFSVSAFASVALLLLCGAFMLCTAKE